MKLRVETEVEKSESKLGGSSALEANSLACVTVGVKQVHGCETFF